MGDIRQGDWQVAVTHSPKQLDTLIVTIGAPDKGHQSVQEVLFFFQSISHVRRRLSSSSGNLLLLGLCSGREKRTTPEGRQRRLFHTGDQADEEGWVDVSLNEHTYVDMFGTNRKIVCRMFHLL